MVTNQNKVPNKTVEATGHPSRSVRILIPSCLSHIVRTCTMACASPRRSPN